MRKSGGGRGAGVMEGGGNGFVEEVVWSWNRREEGFLGEVTLSWEGERGMQVLVQAGGYGTHPSHGKGGTKER